MRRDYRFPTEVMGEVRRGRFEHPHPMAQRRLEAVWLKSEGLTDSEVARLTGTGRRSVPRWPAAYHGGGLEALKRLELTGPESELCGHRGSPEAHFAAHPPRTTAEARDAIERLTGLRRGLTQVRRFLKKVSGRAPPRRATSRPRRTPRRETGSPPEC